MANEKVVQFHATKQILLDTVRTLFATQNPGEITSEQVLAKARVSSGSLYHHFEDFPDLLEQALCIEYEQFTDRTIDLLLMANEQATTLAEWADGVAEARKISHGPTYARHRALRVWAIAYATIHERMKLRLGQAQDRLNLKFVRFVEGAQASGWLIPEIDPLAVAIFVQAYQFGAVVDDITLEHIDQEIWVNLLDMVIKKSFVNQK